MNLILGNEPATEKVIWTITNFNRIPQKTRVSFKSLIIHQGDARKIWRIFLYPSGRFDPNYVACYLSKAYRLFDPMIYNCTMTIGNSDNKPLECYEFREADFDKSTIGLNEFLRRHSIEKLRKGSITVQCEITEVCPKSIFPSIVDDFENLSLDLTVLYQYPVYSDLIVNIQQRQFHLHTCVLYARARRLSHFFGYQSFCEMPKVVQINNICPFLFQQLMLYLYSGKLQGSSCPLGLFICADILKLQSLKQCIYEKVQEHRTHTEISTQNLTVTWNLKEIQFHGKGAVPFVQVFRAACCMNQIAVRMGISEHSDGEKYIDVSFKVFLDTVQNPVSLSGVMTLYSNGNISAYKKASHNIEPDEEWHFPPFVKLSDIPEDCGPCSYLTAEVSFSDGCTAYNNLHTKTLMRTQNGTVTYPERLGFDIKRLVSPKVELHLKRPDISLKLIDDCCVPVHKAILFARWPAIRGYLLNCNDLYLPLNLCSKEIQMLLFYIYTGSMQSSDYSSAKKLLEMDAKLNLPPYLVNKCQNIIDGKTE